MPASPMSPPKTSTRAVLKRLGPGDQAEQGRFADAVRPDQPDHAPGGNIQRHAVEGHDAPVGMAQMAQTHDSPRDGTIGVAAARISSVLGLAALAAPASKRPWDRS